jgi:peptidoglycan/LPS O-acetylase OafA/YrhL
MTMRQRLAWVILALVFFPLLLEALLLDPIRVASFADPVLAVLRLVLVQLMPYLVVAVSGAALMMSSRGLRLASLDRPPRASAVLLLAGLGLAVLTARSSRSLTEALLDGEVSVQSASLQIGDGGPLAPRIPVESVPLEEAGALAQQMLPAAPEPWTATVRWCGLRTAEAKGQPPRVELIADGDVRAVTDELELLRPGEMKIFTRKIRVGPQLTRVRLRLSYTSIPPVTFFDSDWDERPAGWSLESGAGDHAEASSLLPAIESPRAALRPLSIGGPSSIEGAHVDGGYTVLVVSGRQWEEHDLGALRAHAGRLEVTLGQGDPSQWAVRIVGQRAQSDLVPLSRFGRASPEPGVTVHSLALDQVEWRDVPPASVVGVALLYIGKAGPFRIEVIRARAIPPEQSRSGFAVAAPEDFDPSTPPASAVFVAGREPAPGLLERRLAYVRLAAALLLMLGALGPGAAGAVLRERPFAAPLALLVGPALAAVIRWMLPHFAEPRPEQAPVVMALLAVGGATLAWLAPREAPVTAPALPEARERLRWLDGLKVAGILWIIAMHVSTDANGLPYPGYRPEERFVPALVRALSLGFSYPLFFIASFFLLALGLQRRPRSYREVIRRRFRRLVPPFLFWSVVFLLVRHAKATVFGYEATYKRELASASSWLSYAVLGTAQYHLRDLPLLLGLTLLYPLLRPAMRRPALALLLPVTLALWPSVDRLAYASIASPEVLQYGLRAAKSCAFLGYGWLAFALFGMGSGRDARRVRRAMLVSALLVALGSLGLVVGNGLDEAREGRWLFPDLATHLATYLLPAAVFVLALLGERLPWPERVSRLSDRVFGMYLVHPVFLDLGEIAELGRGLTPAATTALNFVVVSALSFWAVGALARVPAVCWTVGTRREEIQA